MMSLGMNRFIVQSFLGSHLFSPHVERNERLFFFSFIFCPVACRFQLLLWFVIIISQFFSGQNLFLTHKVRRYKHRGLFHYKFNVKAAKGEGWPREICHLLRVLWEKQSEVNAPCFWCMMQSYFTALFPVTIILFTVVHSCNCLLSFPPTCPSISNRFMAPDCYRHSVSQQLSDIALILHRGFEGQADIVNSSKLKWIIFIKSSTSLLMNALKSLWWVTLAWVLSPFTSLDEAEDEQYQQQQHDGAHNADKPALRCEAWLHLRHSFKGKRRARWKAERVREFFVKGRQDKSTRGVKGRGRTNMVKEGAESRAKETEHFAFWRWYFTETNSSNGSFHMANQALVSQKSLKALHRPIHGTARHSVGSAFIFRCVEAQRREQRRWKNRGWMKAERSFHLFLLSQRQRSRRWCCCRWSVDDTESQVSGPGAGRKTERNSPFLSSSIYCHL